MPDENKITVMLTNTEDPGVRLAVSTVDNNDPEGSFGEPIEIDGGQAYPLEVFKDANGQGSVDWFADEVGGARTGDGRAGGLNERDPVNVSLRREQVQTGGQGERAGRGRRSA